LFYSRNYVSKLLEKSTLKFNKFYNIFSFKNNFSAYGKKEAKLLDNGYVKYPLLAILLVYLVLFLIGFNKYLNNYENKKLTNNS
jgi:hypothetical protein